MASKTQVSKIITALKPQSTLNELTTMRQDFFNGNFRRAFDTFSILHKKKSDLLKSLNSKDFHGLYNSIRKTPRNSVLDKAQVAQGLQMLDITLKENGIQETPSIYIEKALIFKRLGHSDTLEALFIEMESKGLTRPLNSQNLLCESLANCGKIEQAEVLFNLMLPEKLASGLVNQMSSSYYSILDAYTRNSDFESAQAWWKMADEIKLVKNEQMFDSYLTCIATKSDIATAQDVFAEMQLAGHEKKTRTYNILMRCAINNSNHDETLKLFKEMAEFSIPASSLTYNLLMTVYSAANDPVSVLKVYFSMITSKTASDFNTSKRLGQTFGRKENAKELKSIITKAGGFTSMKIIRTILQGILDHSSDLIRQRSRLSDPSITQQIEQLSTSARIIFDLYRLECGLNKQFVHNSDMYTVYMSLLTQTGCDIEEILRLMKAVEALGLDVGIAFYVRVLYLCSRIKNLQLAATVYTTMIEKEIPRSVKLYDAYISCFTETNMESGKVFSKEVIDVLILFANDSTIGPAGVQSDMCPRLSWVLHQMNPVKNESYSVFIEACINMIKEKGDALVIVNQKEETKQIKREDDLKVEK